MTATGRVPTVQRRAGNAQSNAQCSRVPCEWVEMMAHELAEDALEIPVPAVLDMPDPTGFQSRHPKRQSLR